MKTVEIERCTGHCCEAFTLRFSPKELDRMHEDVNRKEPKGEFKMDNGVIHCNSYGKKEVNKIHSMIIYKGLSETSPEDGKIHHNFLFGKKAPKVWQVDNLSKLETWQKEWLHKEGYVIKDDKVHKHIYTCQHFDGKNCTNYENRPIMCSSHPNKRKCGYSKCTRTCLVEYDQGDTDVQMAKELKADAVKTVKV